MKRFTPAALLGHSRRRSRHLPAVELVARAAATCLGVILFATVAISGGACRGEDARLSPPKDLDGSFPFHPPESVDAWKSRADEVRRRVLVSQGFGLCPRRRI